MTFERRAQDLARFVEGKQNQRNKTMNKNQEFFKLTGTECKVPLLRGELTRFNIGYPSNANKPTLLALFIDYEARVCRAIREEKQASMNPSARGITDV